MGLHVRLADFFLIFKYGPMLQQSVSVTLLLVAFAFGRPSCSNLGGQSFRQFFRKTKLIKFLGLGLVPSRSDSNLIKSLESERVCRRTNLIKFLG